MNSFAKILTLIVLLTLALTACAAPATPAPTDPPAVPTATVPAVTDISLTDGLDRTVTLPAPAQRIVSLAPSNTEILYAVGAGEQVIGRDDFSNYPEAALELPSVGGSMNEYNLEQIVSLQPDLVLAAELNTPDQVRALEELDLTVFYLSNPTDIEGVYAMLRTVAALTGHTAETEELIASLEARVAAVQAQVAGVEDRPVVFYELDGSEPNKPWTAGPGTFIDLLIVMAGGQNAAAQMGGQWGQISQEELLVQNPDVILLGDAAYGVTPEQVA
ncbi:MAG TPA: ABC transporter substrate-binding protein, partial [Anaerolineaceae bacterium]|nr:ABC transporter substrate-binding protein [Anaerolineaceae bacterium]